MKHTMDEVIRVMSGLTTTGLVAEEDFNDDSLAEVAEYEHGEPVLEAS